MRSDLLFGWCADKKASQKLQCEWKTWAVYPCVGGWIASWERKRETAKRWRQAGRDNSRYKVTVIMEACVRRRWKADSRGRQAIIQAGNSTLSQANLFTQTTRVLICRLTLFVHMLVTSLVINLATMFIWEESYTDYKYKNIRTDQQVAYLSTEFLRFSIAIRGELSKTH